MSTDQFSTCVSIYPCPEIVYDWLAHRLWPVDRRAFEYYQHLAPLLDKSDKFEAGRITDFVFDAAIRAFNDQNRAQVTRNQLTCLTTDHLMVDAGDWMLWTDAPETILRAPTNNIELAAYGAPEKVRWAVLCLPRERTMTVYRSPRLGHREFWAQENRDNLLTNLPAAKGRVAGGYQAWVLPPDLEGLITQEIGGPRE